MSSAYLTICNNQFYVFLFFGVFFVLPPPPPLCLCHGRWCKGRVTPSCYPILYGSSRIIDYTIMRVYITTHFYPSIRGNSRSAPTTVKRRLLIALFMI
ncbi:hypothetical protein GDO81_005788 [Engystomops pustulosus]|uniref:Secreted protein n=1 Tax=Engystomops pustulosus TaxID=76066 RepID=A0AAV7CUQ8_ENGPU|nr:hypothetical protein GDO81_005788 [Engystomops pustulosus]